jgi:hypothetical protein
MKKIIVFSLLLVVILGACTSKVEEEPIVETPVDETPVVEKDPSIVAFGEMTNYVNFQLDDVNKFYTLTSPDGQVVFSISAEIAATTPYDYKMEIDATPFINAGLDTALLPEGVFVDNKIVFGHDLGNEGVNVQDVVPAFEAVFRIDPTLVGYHEALDHYGLSFGNGNVFEWASDFTTNDKDLVFVLNPQTFIDAGVDVETIEGWVFAQVEVMDENGKMVMVDKLLKPFDINGK